MPTKKQLSRIRESQFEYWFPEFGGSRDLKSEKRDEKIDNILNMKMRDSIKLLLNCGISIRKSHKSKINEWFGEFELYGVYSIYKKDIKYYSGHQEFDNMDDAIEYFMENCLTSKNKGYIQQRLSKKIDFESEYDLENPSPELIKIFEDEGKIVDQEFKYI